jgi:hypothetical protein
MMLATNRATTNVFCAAPNADIVTMVIRTEPATLAPVIEAIASHLGRDSTYFAKEAQGIIR